MTTAAIREADQSHNPHSFCVKRQRSCQLYIAKVPSTPLACMVKLPLQKTVGA
ncbi:hypothetical protein BDV98DRAFT_568881 [Pterulicium gracile]|uniref:Uncharacterized protein n=1 Tax=Pterulicium gracile TaxID=1884261 RepID=A0A5C3QFW0_9AGAR|nr:hypothetical protein BDV98DRAFT_568881 [Pterula gracilis]